MNVELNGASAPTERGWHWHWDGDAFRMMFVFPRPGHSYLAVQEETAAGKRQFVMASKLGGQWFGPINPPDLHARHSAGDADHSPGAGKMGEAEEGSLRFIAKRNLRRMIEIGSTDKSTMLLCLEELS